jgi:hypothetical protein
VVLCAGVPVCGNERGLFADAKVTGTPSHELRQVAEIRRLTVAEANRNIPVRLRAVVTYYDPLGPDLFVQDQTGGIWVDVETTKLNVPVSAGDLVEVTGVTEQLRRRLASRIFTLLGRRRCRNQNE